MIYVDSSVVLAHVFAEGIGPSVSFWNADLVTSRLTEFECWVRVHAYGRGASHGPALAAALARLDVIALDEEACARTRASFPVPVRTLDAIHLATADFFRCRGFVLDIATYDARMRAAAVAMGFGLSPLG